MISWSLLWRLSLDYSMPTSLGPAFIAWGLRPALGHITWWGTGEFFCFHGISFHICCASENSHTESGCLAFRYTHRCMLQLFYKILQSWPLTMKEPMRDKIPDRRCLWCLAEMHSGRNSLGIPLQRTALLICSTVLPKLLIWYFNFTTKNTWG